MKKLLALALTLAMVLSLAACGGGGSGGSSEPASSEPASSEPAGEPSSSGEATKMTLILRGGTYAEALKAALPAFEKDNNVTIEVQELSFDDLHTGIALDSVNPEGAYDLCMVDGSWMAEFTDSGVLANLTELGYALDDDVIPATTSICYVDGQL